MRRSAQWVLVALLPLAMAACSGDNSSELALSGTVEARETALAFQVSGRIEQLLTDEGSQVKQGQEVALLNDKDYAEAVTRARADVAAAQAALAVLQAGTRRQELKVAEATLQQSRDELRFAESDVARVRSLVSKRLASQELLDQAVLKRDVATSVVRRAEQQLQLLREGPRQEEIKQAEAILAARQSALASAEQQHSYTRLISPVEGSITLRQAEAGEVVASGQTVFKVAELSHPWVRAYINETDLTRVKLGQKVTVTVDGLPGKSFEGILSFISPKAEFTPKSVETRELRVDLVYRIKVQLEDKEGLLKLGMPADIRFD